MVRRGVLDNVAVAGLVPMREARLRPASPQSADGGTAIAAPALATSAISMTIANAGNQRDRLTGATSGAATAIERHQTRMANNMAQLQRVQAIDIPARGEASIRPGQYRPMLTGPTRDAGKLTMLAQVRDY
jgi:copper(I)-binding protein